MRKIFLFIAAIFGACQLPAQKPFKQNTVYFEMAGNGLVLSLNYERQISSKPGLGLHAGVGLADNKPSFPSELNTCLIWAGKIFFRSWGWCYTCRAGYVETNYNQSKPDPYKAGFIPSVGYTYKAPKGFMWGINYTPVFNKYRTELLYFGLSIGWRI
jgi:hypothetical protein